MPKILPLYHINILPNVCRNILQKLGWVLETWVFLCQDNPVNISLLHMTGYKVPWGDEQDSEDKFLDFTDEVNAQLVNITKIQRK